jgi:hypothetical protein
MLRLSVISIKHWRIRIVMPAYAQEELASNEVCLGDEIIYSD